MKYFRRNPDLLENLTFDRILKKFIELLCTHRYSQDLKVELRKKIIMLPHMYQKRILNCILTDTDLTSIIRIRVLDIIMNKNFQEFTFYQPVEEIFAGPKIMQILYNNCLRIKTLDLTTFYIRSQDRELFENLIEKFTELETIQVRMRENDCAIHDILLGDSIRKDNNGRRINNRFIRILINIYNKIKRRPNLVERSINIPIEKIDCVDLCRRLPLKYCVQLLRILPNVSSFGTYNKVGKALTLLKKKECKNLNLTYLHDDKTSVKTLYTISKHCPILNRIRLSEPQPKTLRNLHFLPCITQIELSYFNTYELMEYVTNYGWKLRELRLEYSTCRINLNTVLESCPILSHLRFHDVMLEYVPPKKKIMYKHIRSFYYKRIYSGPSIGIKKLMFCLPNIEHIDVDDIRFTDNEIEKFMRLNLWDNLITLCFSGPFDSYYSLTIRSLISILTHCNNLEEIRNIDHFLVDPTDFPELLEYIQNCKVKCKLIRMR